MQLTVTKKTLDTRPIKDLLNQGEANVDIIEISMDADYDGLDISGYNYEIRATSEKDTLATQPLAKSVRDGRIILIWTITEDFTAVSGRLDLTIVGINDEGDERIRITGREIFVRRAQDTSFTAPAPDGVAEALDRMTTMVAQAQAAADRAEAAIVHGPYIGDNQNWYVWDVEAGGYTDTNIAGIGPRGPQGPEGPRGASGPPLHIAGTYDTLDALVAAYPDGDGDNSYLVGAEAYVWDGTTWQSTSMGGLSQGDQQKVSNLPEDTGAELIARLSSPRTAASTLKTRTTDIAAVTIRGSTEGVGTGGSITFTATNGIDTNTATLPLAEPLRRLGEVYDEYDGKTGRLTRRIGLSGGALSVLPQPVISYHRADLACYDGDTNVTCSDPQATDMEVAVYDSRPAGDARSLGGQLPHVYMQSNPNVLVNGSFTVNQRGFTSVANVYDAYGVDCWRFSGGINDTWSLKKDDGTYLHCTAPAGRAINRQPHIRQWFEADLRGKQVTISLECWNQSNETAHSSFYFWDGATSTGGPDIDTVQIPNSDHWIVVHKTFVVPKTFGDEYQSLLIRPAWQTEAVKIDLKVRRVKIELGPVSTLHLDPPPNPALELAKCQRYLLPLKTDASFAGRTRSANAAQILATIPTPVQMRVNPALTGGLAFNAAKDNVFKPITSVSTIAGSNCILLSGEVGAGYTQGTAITAYAISHGYLSAEL